MQLSPLSLSLEDISTAFGGGYQTFFCGYPVFSSSTPACPSLLLTGLLSFCLSFLMLNALYLSLWGKNRVKREREQKSGKKRIEGNYFTNPDMKSSPRTLQCPFLHLPPPLPPSFLFPDTVPKEKKRKYTPDS